MLRLKHTFVEIAFLNTLLFLIGCGNNSESHLFIALNQRIEKSIVHNTPETKDGHFSLPQGSGWGIDLNMELLKDYISSDYWHREEYFLEDGTPAHI